MSTFSLLIIQVLQHKKTEGGRGLEHTLTQISKYRECRSLSLWEAGPSKAATGQEKEKEASRLDGPSAGLRPLQVWVWSRQDAWFRGGGNAGEEKRFRGFPSKEF